MSPGPTFCSLGTRTLFALSNDVPDIDSFVFDRSFPLPMEETRFVTGKAPITLPYIFLLQSSIWRLPPNRPYGLDHFLRTSCICPTFSRMRPAWPNTCCLTF